MFLVAYSLFWFNECNTRTFLAFALIGSLLGGTIVFLYCRGTFAHRERSTIAFGSILALFAVLYAFVFPPFSVPDEGHHYFGAYWISDLITGETTETGYLVRDEDWNMFESFDNSVSSRGYRNVIEDFRPFSNSQKKTNVDVPALSFTPKDLSADNGITRIGTVAAILLGKALGLGAYPLFYLGRLFNAAIFVACMVASFKMTPVGRNVIVAISLLPMTLHLAGSFSYDPVIIGIATFLCTLFLRAIMDAGQITKKTCALLIVGSCLLAPLKMVYSTVILLGLFIPNRRFGSKRNAILFKVSILLIPMLMLGVVRLSSINDLTMPSSESLDVRGIERGHFYSLSSLLENPLATLSLFARTLEVKGDFYWTSALGQSLGWFQANLIYPSFYLIPILFGIGYAAQRDTSDTIKLPGVLRITLATIAILSFAGIMLSMCLIWTFDTEAAIEGVQGRYILPVALPLLLSLRSPHINNDRDAFPLVITLFSFMNIIILMNIVASALIG